MTTNPFEPTEAERRELAWEMCGPMAFKAARRLIAARLLAIADAGDDSPEAMKRAWRKLVGIHHPSGPETILRVLAEMIEGIAP